MMEGQDTGSAVKLAIAILLFWLAGVCFFIAFEGSKFLGEGLTSESYVATILKRVATTAQEKEQQP